MSDQPDCKTLLRIYALSQLNERELSLVEALLNVMEMPPEPDRVAAAEAWYQRLSPAMQRHMAKGLPVIRGE